MYVGEVFVCNRQLPFAQDFRWALRTRHKFGTHIELARPVVHGSRAAAVHRARHGYVCACACDAAAFIHTKHLILPVFATTFIPSFLPVFARKSGRELGGRYQLTGVKLGAQKKVRRKTPEETGRTRGNS